MRLIIFLLKVLYETIDFEQISTQISTCTLFHPQCRARKIQFRKRDLNSQEKFKFGQKRLNFEQERFNFG